MYLLGLAPPSHAPLAPPPHERHQYKGISRKELNSRDTQLKFGIQIADEDSVAKETISQIKKRFDEIAALRNDILARRKT